MNLHLVPTHRIHRFEGQRCRLWTGSTDEGLAVKAWIAMIEVDSTDSVEVRQLENSLMDLAAPARLRAIESQDPAENDA